MKGKNRSMHILVGSMLFGLFFGAGNLIFPVHMGQQAGQNVWVATIGFLITATGLPFLAVVAMGLSGCKNVFELGSRVHKVYGYILTIMLYLTIGPLFALPRTATVSFQVGLSPIFSSSNQWIALLIFSIMFFVVALFFALRPSRILDWVGKFLNPIFLVFISFLFIRAIISPMAPLSTIPALGSYETSALTKGFVDGYQTMDVLAGLAFAMIVVNAIKGFGITDSKEIAISTIKSGIATLVLMVVVYSGLSWLGATSVGVFPPSENGGIALAQISNFYLGSLGSIFLAITITIACLKTAIGLITACSATFVEIFPNSLSYNKYAVLFAVFSCVVANVGLTQIITLAMPMLMLIYPLSITLILLTLMERFIGKRRVIYVSATIGASIIGLVDSLKVMPDFIKNLGVVQSIIDFCKSYVPLFNIDMGWLIPALIGLIIGIAISKLFPEKNPKHA